MYSWHLFPYALYQFIGGTRLELFTYPREMLERHARALHPEKVQLGYQIILAGIDELRLASDSRTAFEMALLRLLAFVPEKKKN